MYRSAVDGAAFNTLLRRPFPFRYLTDDYGLTITPLSQAALPKRRLTSRRSHSFQRSWMSLLPAVIAPEGSDHRIAETIVQNTKSKNQRILVLDSMQSVAAKT